MNACLPVVNSQQLGYPAKSLQSVNSKIYINFCDSANSVTVFTLVCNTVDFSLLYFFLTYLFLQEKHDLR